MRKNTEPKQPKPLKTQPTMTLAEIIKTYSNEDACKSLLRDLRWPDAVRCPRCQKSERIYELKHRPFHWVCKNADCGGRNGYRFSVITKTVFENTNYPVSTWFQVIYLLTQSKKGMSSLQIHRQIKSGSYKTAWYMTHRIRSAMKGDVLPLAGDVEVDETFIGGKNKNKHWDKKIRNTKGSHGSGKIPVIGAIARKGNVVAKMIENTDKPTLDGFVREAVSKKVSLLATDEHTGYADLAPCYPHGIVKHSQGEYVVGAIHTNTIEGFWSLLKRGIVGTYHKVSRDYLPLYLNEFSFRYNNRENPDIFRAVIAGC